MKARVRTGLFQDEQGYWHVVIEVNGHRMAAKGTWPTEQEAEDAAVVMANRVRDAVGMPTLDGGDA